EKRCPLRSSPHCRASPSAQSAHAWIDTRNQHIVRRPQIYSRVRARLVLIPPNRVLIAVLFPTLQPPTRTEQGSIATCKQYERRSILPRRALRSPPCGVSPWGTFPSGPPPNSRLFANWHRRSSGTQARN